MRRRSDPLPPARGCSGRLRLPRGGCLARLRPLANGYALTQAQHDALVNAFTIDAATHSSVNGSGTIGWHYDIADSALDFLGASDQVVLTYTVKTADGNGGTAQQDVTVTIHGSNDAPVITSATQSGAVTEDADLSANENNETHHQSGTVTFGDVDLSDIETSSIAATQVAATLANGYALTQAQQDALVGAFTIDAATHSHVNGSGTIGWHYDIADSALDFLGANDQVVLTYTVKTADGNGGTAQQDVTVTINGTNDAPVITSGTQSGSVTEDADLSANENNETHHQSGTVTFSDVDLSDIETSSITSKQVSASLANGYALTTAQHDALVNAFTIDAATHSQADGTGTIGWNYDLADSALDFLGANDVVTLTYTVQTSDGNGGTAQPGRHRHHPRHQRRAGDHHLDAVGLGDGGCRSFREREQRDPSSVGHRHLRRRRPLRHRDELDCRHPGRGHAGERLCADAGPARRAGQRLHHQRGDAFER